MFALLLVGSKLPDVTVSNVPEETHKYVLAMIRARNDRVAAAYRFFDSYLGRGGVVIG